MITKICYDKNILGYKGLTNMNVSKLTQNDKHQYISKITQNHNKNKNKNKKIKKNKLLKINKFLFLSIKM